MVTPFAIQSAFGATFGLVLVFGGIGVGVNALIAFIVAQVFGERAENQRDVQQPRSDSTP